MGKMIVNEMTEDKVVVSKMTVQKINVNGNDKKQNGC